MGKGERIAVLGGTGRTGALIAESLSAGGREVTVVGRSACRTKVPPGVTATAADVLDSAALHAVLEGHSHVVLALSIPRVSPSPFAALAGPPNLHSASLTLLLPILDQLGIRRVVKLSAQGVGDSAPRAGWGLRAFVAASTLRHAYADHAKADDLLRSSSLDWTIVRPPVLTDGESRPVRASETLTTTTFSRISRASVARYVAACLFDRGTVRRALTIA